MAKLAQLPANDGAAQAEGRSSPLPRLRTRYYAFLSYSHRDKELADWLQRELERFRVPHSLAGKLTANGVVPRRLTPIFRDQQDLSAGADLGEEIKAALAASQFLIVLCSPTAATSRWTNAEIESFKRTRPEGCVLAAVVGGEPFASDIPGREAEECFPPALRFKYDRRGHQTAKRAEPLAADFREAGEGKRLAFLKLVAGMLGVGLDELVQRDTTRRHRQLAWLAAGSLAGMAVTSTLAVTAIQARNEAREQRREAEGLLGFMLGDLKDKLEPIGRLDALDGVGARVLAYYQKQDTADLSDAALSQRSSALSLMAQVADSRGDVDGSLKLYREAMAGTGESIRRNPGDGQALFDHAQNVFYVGQIAHSQGDLETAERSMREYQRLATRMVALQPDNLKFRMEGQYAAFNLGVVLYNQRRFAEAATQFSGSLSTIKAISTADPTNQEYRKGVADSLAWLADSHRAAGRYDDAIDTRKRNIALLEQLLGQSRSVQYRQRLIAARRALGNLYAEHGQRDLGIEQIRTAITDADLLRSVEPSNTQWLEYASRTRGQLARQLLLNGQTAEATAQTVTFCDGSRDLLRHDATKPEWQIILFGCFNMRAQLALAGGNTDQALALAKQAAEVARNVQTVDKVADASRIARAQRFVGDIERSKGNGTAAHTAWAGALAALPSGVPEQPDEVAERAAILQRLGRGAEAQPLTAKLNSIGYRQPV